jgi:Histidine kinase-, DNA gyrase B-, and HSP90-like ATPase
MRPPTADGQRLRGPSAETPGTYQSRCPASFRSTTTLPTPRGRRSTAGMSCRSPTQRSCSSASAVSAPTFRSPRADRQRARRDRRARRPRCRPGGVGPRLAAVDASGGRVRKLSVTDTGTGMTPEQLRRYINQLASSGREQSGVGNFGVGAKIAAGSRNPHGLEYRSWCRGQGALVCFKRHPNGRWGLEPQRWKDGHTDYWRPLGEADKPSALRGGDRGHPGRVARPA